MIQLEQVKFGITIGRIWKMATTGNMRKSPSENLVFLSSQTEFWKLTHWKTNLGCSTQNLCLRFSRFIFIFPKRTQICHFLSQRIFELEYLIMSWISNLQSGRVRGG